MQKSEQNKMFIKINQSKNVKNKKKKVPEYSTVDYFARR